MEVKLRNFTLSFSFKINKYIKSVLGILILNMVG